MKECGRCSKVYVWGSEGWSPGRPISQATESVRAFPSEGFSRKSPLIQKVLISDSYFHGLNITPRITLVKVLILVSAASS